jgi:hypothetical protein
LRRLLCNRGRGTSNMSTTQLALYLLAATIFAGIGFLIWMLVHLFLESRRDSRSQPAYHSRWRYRMRQS